MSSYESLQSAYHPYHFTEIALLHVQNDILIGKDSKREHSLSCLICQQLLILLITTSCFSG